MLKDTHILDVEDINRAREEIKNIPDLGEALVLELLRELNMRASILSDEYGQFIKVEVTQQAYEE